MTLQLTVNDKKEPATDSSMREKLEYKDPKVRIGQPVWRSHWGHAVTGKNGSLRRP